jgi:hypothetical protein
MNSANLYRIRLLIRRQWIEHFKAYLVGLLLLVLSLVFLYVITFHWRDSFSGGVRNGIFIVGLFLGGGLFSNSLLNELTNRSRGVWLLTLPAAAIDKIITAIFFSLLVYPVVYVLVFTLIDKLYVLFLESSSMKAEPVDLFRNGFYNFFFYYFIYTAIIAFGSIRFSKAAFIKSLLLIISILFIVFNGNNILLALITGVQTISSNTPFNSFQFRNNGENVYVTMPGKISMVMDLLLKIVLPLFLWYITYQRLREKQL